MAAECPFCGYRNTAYEVQMHIEERHAYDSPLPTRRPPPRARDYQPRQQTRNSPALTRERGERFKLPPPSPEPKRYPIERRPLDPHPSDEYPIREKRIITKTYPFDEPWIQCGRQGCGMYVARDVMNQHLDMHDMYEYEAERENAKRMQQRRLSAGGAMKRLDLVPFDPDSDGALSDYSRRDSFVDPGGKGGSLVSGDTAKYGSREKSQGGQSGGSVGSNGLRQQRFGSSGNARNGQGGGGDGADGGDKSSASKNRPKLTKKDDRRGGWSRSSISSKNKGKNAAKSNSGNSQKGGDASGPSSNGPAGGMHNNTANNGRNGARPNSNSGANQRNGSGGGGGGGGDGGGGDNPSNPNDIRRRIDSGSSGDTSNLELQLAKLLLANRGSGSSGGGGGGGNDPNLINSALGLPTAPSPKDYNPPKPNSTFSLSGVSTSELLQAIQKKTNGSGGSGGRGQGQGVAFPSDADADANGLNNASSRIPSEAAGLLAAIVASRVRS